MDTTPSTTDPRVAQPGTPLTDPLATDTSTTGTSAADTVATTANTTATAAATTTANTTALTDRRGWLGVLSVALGSFVLVLSEFLPIGLLPAISTDLGVSIGVAGLMVVATGLVAAISSPVVTVATSRLDRRTVLVSLTVLLVGADILAAFAPNFALLLVGRMLLGVSLGGFWAIGAGLASRLVKRTAVIRATSFITAGISIATVVSLPLGSFIAAAATWRLAFIMGAVLGALALVAQFILLPRIPAAGRIKFATLGALLTIPRARIGLIATVFVFLAQFAAYTYVAPYLQQLVRATPNTITIALLAFGIAGIAGNFVAGYTLSRSITITLLVSKIVLGASVLLLPILAHSTTGVILLLVIWGFVWGALPLAAQTWMASSSPSSSEGSLALFVTTIQIAIAAGSIIGGIAVSTIGLSFDFYLAGVLAALGAVVLITLGSRKNAQISRPESGSSVSAAHPSTGSLTTASC